MERLQGPINPCFLGDHFDVEGLGQGFFNAESLKLEEEGEDEVQYLIPSLEDKMPFLQMLQSVETPSFFSSKEPNFQALLRLQHLKTPWDVCSSMPELDPQAQARDPESCVTHDLVDLQPPSPVKSETKDHQNPPSISSCLEGATPEPKHQEQQPNSTEFSPFFPLPQTKPNKTQYSKSSLLVASRERRKRKRSRPAKNKEEVESQRMTHIAVERNRRRQMNDYLSTLRSLMPPSYVQRGDQASIIGGAIDFVKELEQLLQTLEAQKRIGSADTTASIGVGPDNLFTSHPQQFNVGGQESGSSSSYCENQETRKRISEVAEIEVRTAVQNHVNLKVQCLRRPGQLLRAVIALEELRLTVLHLNISSSETNVLYSFNLKIEDDCQLGSEDEIVAAVHQIFSIISISGS
ncbi:hypothetical protein Tsubulata_018308 [Turnera subulata]|uniref:BHLH domain-containing protein n=1 Tax=Turnera subulata TaxID=218843 RepID=A0A9Q0JQD2_9ROSI|nr:hypothetical protein Tsubulata_018308 [Turnera subulata]